MSIHTPHDINEQDDRTDASASPQARDLEEFVAAFRDGAALNSGNRLFSSYELSPSLTLLIITELDASAPMSPPDEQ
ncbi:Uncharacterised protein [Burkholderia pseudomallei]|uniref:hypothetical protein n=1 Tax=Burkholderia pseudomallei TaxID=28450 RepID=UPI0005DEFE97|nr:hypothetical protein [Burkholderia pseudomallei]CFU00872.1 Uncharacterised protein [Burkholderia pseudomallei]CPI08686.1 Uncharacterised protein [Burkholderia pseudomallei]